MRVPAHHPVSPQWGVATGEGRASPFDTLPLVHWSHSVVPLFTIFRSVGACRCCGGVMREPARHLRGSFWAMPLEAGQALLAKVPPFSP